MSYGYGLSNKINRSIDSFNFPDGLPLMHRIWGIRLLIEHNAKRNIHRYIPSLTELDTRLTSLLDEAILDPVKNQHIIHEIHDIIVSTGRNIPLRINTEQYAPHITRNVRQSKVSVPQITISSIINDSQNVHNSAINNNVKQIATNFKQDYSTTHDLMPTIIGKLSSRKDWDEKNIASLDFIHSSTATFGIEITLTEVLTAIFLWITKHPDKEELYIRLNQELTDMYKLCSTGHLARLINVPQGYTDNPRYILGIEPKNEIKNFIFKTLTNSLQSASDDIQDGMIDKSEAFIKFINNTYDNNKNKWVEDFGEEYSGYIKECVDLFIG